jgi:hypothetical protein
MNTMTWEEIARDWSGLQKKHRMEIAQAVAKYCIGHKMQEVAERLGQSVRWVQSKLDMAGVSAGIGESGGSPTLVGKHRGLQEDCEKVVQQFQPKAEVTYSGTTKDSIASITGADAEGFQPYLDHYITLGHEPAAAVRLAKAEWAAEEAIEKGVIKESVNKRNERVNSILFPSAGSDKFELDLKSHMARVSLAARFLDEAKMQHLRRKSTLEKVAAADEKWREQMARVLHSQSVH